MGRARAPGKRSRSVGRRVPQMNARAARGGATVVRSPVRAGNAQRAPAKGMIKPGHHADHALDLQYGGADDIANVTSAPARITLEHGASPALSADAKPSRTRSASEAARHVTEATATRLRASRRLTAAHRASVRILGAIGLVTLLRAVRQRIASFVAAAHLAARGGKRLARRVAGRLAHGLIAHDGRAARFITSARGSSLPPACRRLIALDRTRGLRRLAMRDPPPTVSGRRRFGSLAMRHTLRRLANGLARRAR